MLQDRNAVDVIELPRLGKRILQVVDKINPGPGEKIDPESVFIELSTVFLLVIGLAADNQSPSLADRQSPSELLKQRDRGIH